MNGWNVASIGDLVIPVSTWDPICSSDRDSFSYIDLSAIDQQSKNIVEPREVLCSEAPSRARQLVAARDILISTVRPNLNGVAQVPEELDGATASTGFCVLRPAQHRLDPRFLFHWVKSEAFVDDMVKKATGASYPAVSDRIVYESRIPLPPLPEQRRIAAILDQAEALRAKRREVIGKLDAMTQSIFFEMFGNPAASPKSRESCQLRDLVLEFRYGTSNKSQSHGFPTLRIPNVSGGEIDLSDLKLVPVDEAEFARLRLIDGDVLFVRTNGNPAFVGRCAVFDSATMVGSKLPSGEFLFASYLIRARLDMTRVAPIFIREFMLGNEGRKQLMARSKTSAGQFNINTEGLGTIPVPLPSLSLQREFSRRVAVVEKAKKTQLASLHQLDLFFSSLQHRAFRGEL